MDYLRQVLQKPFTMLRIITLTRFFICLSGIVLLQTLPVTAQQMSFVNVSSKLQLPAMECYGIFQDSKGYMWISTEAGLCRYNGSTLEVFDKRNGLPEKAVYAITEAEDGLLWFVTSQNRILFYKEGQLHEAPFSSKYQSLVPGTLTYMIRKRSRDELLLNSYTSTYTINLVTHSLDRIQGAGAMHQVFLERKNKELIALNGYVPYPVNAPIEDKKLQLVLMEGPRRDTVRTAVAIRYIYNSRLLACSAGMDLFCSGSDKLFRISPSKELLVTDMKGKIISLYADKDNGVWVGTYRNGVCYFDAANGPGKCITLLKGLSVSGICEDKEGNIWLSTLEKGIFVCKNKRIATFANIPNLDQPVDMLKNVDGMVLASAGINKLYVLNTVPVRVQELGFNRIDVTTDVISLDRNKLLVLKGMLVETDRHFRALYQPAIPTGRPIGDGNIIEGDSSEFYLLGFLWLMKYSSPAIKLQFRLPGKGIDMCRFGKDSFLVGCRNGLYAFRRKDSVLRKIPGINKAVTRILKASDQAIWIATKEEGLFLFRQNKLRSMNKTLDLRTEAIFNIAEDPFRNIWLGSDAGLIRLAYPFDRHSAQYYSTANGLPDNEVLKLATDSQYVYVSTGEGISRVPLSGIAKRNPPPVYLNYYTVNGQKHDNKINGQTFAYNQNNLEFNFDILSFDFRNRSGLLFRLNENSYVPLKGNVLKLYNLGHGDHQLVVYGVSADGIKSAYPVSINFSIGIPFWKTWQFILLTPLFLAAMVYYLFNRKIKQVKKAAEEKNKLSKLISSYQLFALQAQMNPHFIFNSINSIQYFILQQREEDAYQYLTKFSRLIRNVLNNSGKLDIPLNQEIDMLKTYIELEQCRFIDKFDYELNVSEDIDALTISLPPMLIQPYVENAIWHGLLNLRSERKGKLTLCFLMEGQLLKVVILDNGVGRERAAMKKERTHTPVAMELTAKRLDMVHQIWGDGAIKINITDLYDEHKMPVGTQVDLYLPLNTRLHTEN